MPIPLRLIAAAVVLAPAAAAQTPHPTTPPIAPAELSRRLETLVDSLARDDRFSGVVLLAHEGRPVLQRAYGYADRERRRGNTLETAFNLGSINKLFTRVAVMQLVMAGKLNLDATLDRYWPDYPNADVARQVTIGQLLEHRSGIGGNIFQSPAGGTRASLRHNRDFLPLFVHEPLEFPPGSAQRYSNAGYVVLGMVVERVSGEDYYAYVRRHIYDPAGMARSGHFTIDSLPPNTAIGYTRGDPDAPTSAPLRPNTDELPGRGSAAGGGYSTAGDLLRLLQAFRERRVVASPRAGLGIAGGSGGVNALVEGGLGGGFDLIVLANLDPPAAEAVGERVRGWLGAPD
jgi:CubicO group peptidase (beta-lactamase class C family)